MNDDQLNDLKQFIDSRLSQTETRFDEKFELKLEALRAEVQDGFGGIAEAIEQLHEQSDAESSDVAQRLTKLEQQAA